MQYNKIDLKDYGLKQTKRNFNMQEIYNYIDQYIINKYTDQISINSILEIEQLTSEEQSKLLNIIIKNDTIAREFVFNEMQKFIDQQIEKIILKKHNFWEINYAQ